MTSLDRKQNPRRRIALTAAFLAGAIALPAAFAAVGSNGSVPLAGQLSARHSDDFAHGRSTMEYVVESDGKIVPVRVSERQATPLLGKRVHVSYRADGSAELVAADGTSGGTTTATTVATGTERKVAIILLNFSNDARQPWTREQVRAAAFDDATKSVAAYYRQASWGQLLLSGDVLGWYTIPESSASGCNYSAWSTSANAAATTAGVNLANYQHVVYAFPSVSSCGWSGLAYMPGRYSWLNNAGTSLRTMAHELGHNFGTHHASTLNCTQSGVRVSLSATASNCTLNEYGDPFSVMGASSKYEPTNYSRGNFGWLQAANTLTVSAAGDYQLNPINPYDTTAVQSLRVKRTSSTFLTLELRQPDGSYFDSFASTDPAVTGVSVRITTEYTTRSQSQLLDANPSTAGFADAPLQSGQTLVDPLTGVSITTVSVASTGATVRVSFAPDVSAPTQPANLAAKALDTSRIQLAWGASSDNIGVAGYRVLRGGVLVATVTGTGYTDTGLAPKTAYGYEVVAFDAAGNTSPAAAGSATTLAADTQAPSAPANLGATLGKGKKVTLSWSASADDVGVTGYRIFKNSSQTGTTTATSYNDTLGGKTPTATYYVVAYDAAGNASPPSVSVSVG
jgi:chitodextrinase